MPLLGAPVRLHDVRDVEAFCRSAVDEYLRKHRAHLRPDLYDSLLTFTIGLTFVLSERYDRTRSAQRFSSYAGRIVRLRATDWFRQEFSGRRADKTLPLSLEVAIAAKDARLPASENVEDAVVVASFLSSLEPPLREVASLANAGFDEREIAERVGISLVQVRWRLGRVRETLTGQPDPERQRYETNRESAELFEAGLRPMHVGALLSIEPSSARSMAKSWARIRERAG